MTYQILCSLSIKVMSAGSVSGSSISVSRSSIRKIDSDAARRVLSVSRYDQVTSRRRRRRQRRRQLCRQLVEGQKCGSVMVSDPVTATGGCLGASPVSIYQCLSAVEATAFP